MCRLRRSGCRAGRGARAALPRGPDAAAGALFGDAISVDTGLALIGAPGDATAGAGAGAAYLYAKQGASWLLSTKLIASDATAGDGGS